MKIWDITYTNAGREGTAIVAAQTASQAGIVLQSSGNLNGTKYNIAGIKDIGCNNLPYVQLISESYTGQEEDTPNVPDAPGNGKFDVDSLTDEDIAKLRTRLDIHERAIYVNRIGNAPYHDRIFEGKRTVRQDGYLLFCTGPCISPNISEGVKLMKYPNGYELKFPCLLLLRDNTYTSIPIPNRVQFIISPSRIISIQKRGYSGKYYSYICYSWTNITNTKRKKYCLFSLGVSNHRYYDGELGINRTKKRHLKWKPVFNDKWKPLDIELDESIKNIGHNRNHDILEFKDYLKSLIAERLPKDSNLPRIPRFKSHPYTISPGVYGEVRVYIFTIGEYKFLRHKNVKDSTLHQGEKWIKFPRLIPGTTRGIIKIYYHDNKSN